MPSESFPSLQSERLILRCIKESELPTFLAYLNDPIVAKYQTWDEYPEERARGVLSEQEALKPGWPGKTILFATEVKASAALAGHVVLTIQEKDPKQAEIGFTFAQEFQGFGLAREASELVMEYAFGKLDLHRVFAITDCENQSSIKLLQRLGMRREGHFIQNIWFKGHWGDEYMFAILQEEWRASRDSKVSANANLS